MNKRSRLRLPPRLAPVCPECRVPIEGGWKGANTDHHAQPGDLAVCTACGAFLELDEALAPTIMRAAVLRDLDNDELALMSAIREASVRRRGGEALH